MAESKSGSFIVNNNTGSFTVNVDADRLTDGQKTMSVQIRRDSVRGQVIGNLSAPITVNDTSFTPAGTIISQGCVPGTYTYRITKANGQGGTYNEDTPNSVTCGYVAPPTYPAAGTILSQGCVPGTYTYRVTKANGSGGSVNEDTPNSVSCGYVAPANPVYSFIRSVSNVNEGSSFNITFNTNQSGSFPYTISGVSSADIGGASLSGSVSNGQVLTFNVTADSTTEGTETFTISLNNGQANTTVTINDTSRTPNPGIRPVITSISPNEHIVYSRQPTSSTISGSGFTGVTVLTFTYVASGSSSIRQFNLTGSDFQILNDSTIVFSTPGIGSANVSSTCNLTVANSSGESNAVTYRFKADYTLYDLPTSIRRGSTYYVILRTGFYGGSVLLQYQGGSQSFTLDVNGYVRVGFYTVTQNNFFPYQVTFPDGYSISGNLQVTG